jgi:hypothetical protein
MPGLDFDASIYVKSVPEFRREEGMFHICHTVGKMHIELVMRPNTFLKALRNANRVAAEFHAQGEVVAMRGNKP